MISKVLDKVDWTLLGEQKAVLVKMTMDRSPKLDKEETTAIDGILCFIDGIQDEQVDSGVHTEKEIFKKLVRK